MYRVYIYWFIKKCFFMLHLITLLYQTRSIYIIFMNCYEGKLTCLQCWLVCLKNKKEQKCLCMYRHRTHGSLWSPNGFLLILARKVHLFSGQITPVIFTPGEKKQNIWNCTFCIFKLEFCHYYWILDATLCQLYFL